MKETGARWKREELATNAWAEDDWLPEKTLLRVSRSRSGPGKVHMSTTCPQLLHKRYSWMGAEMDMEVLASTQEQKDAEGSRAAE